MTNCELVESQHISDWHLWDDCSIEFGSLVGACRYKKTTIWTSLNCQMGWVSIALLNQVFSSSVEIIETVLFFLFITSFMPIFSILTTSSEWSNAEHSSKILHKEQKGRTEVWCDWNVESTIAIQDCWDRWCWLGIKAGQSWLLLYHKHWNFCAILTCVEHLVRLEVCDIDWRILQLGCSDADIIESTI